MTSARPLSSQNGSFAFGVHDDHGVGDPPGFVDGFLVGRVQGIERVEPAPELVVHLGGPEGVQNLDGLAETPAMRRSPAPSGRRDRGVFALGVHEDGTARPFEQRGDYETCALAAA